MNEGTKGEVTIKYCSGTPGVAGWIVILEASEIIDVVQLHYPVVVTRTMGFIGFSCRHTYLFGAAYKLLPLSRSDAPAVSKFALRCYYFDVFDQYRGRLQNMHASGQNGRSLRQYMLQVMVSLSSHASSIGYKFAVCKLEIANIALWQ